MFCQKCGVENSNNADYCKACGSGLNENISEPEQPYKHPKIRKITKWVATFFIYLNAIVIFIYGIVLIGIGLYFLIDPFIVNTASALTVLGSILSLLLGVCLIIYGVTVFYLDIKIN
jgi:hypothetical protein